MKHISINNLIVRILFMSGAFVLVSMFSACSDNDPAKENVPELITEVVLTFSPTGGGAAVVATAVDPDGEGVQDLIVDGPIDLAENTTYTLAIELINGLADPMDDGYDITAEVQEEADEHLLFFGWTNDVFSNPTGNGNIDSRADAVNYNDEDENGLPLGLNTSWTSSAEAAVGTFRVILKHQPDLKSETSTSSMGETDLDLTFTINIE